MSSTSHEHPVLRTAARHGLGVAVPVARLFDEDLAAVLAFAEHDRLTGLVVAALDDGAVATSAPSRTAVVDTWHEQLLTSVVVEAATVRAATILDAAGVRWRLTKGAALAHLDYPSPGQRLFGDTDLLIHPDSWDIAVDALGAAGCVRGQHRQRRSYERRYGKGVTLTAPDGLQLDLHRRLAVGRFAVASHPEDLFATASSGSSFAPSDTITLAGRAVPVLAPSGRLLHACFHAELGGYRGLRAFRDVAQLLLVTAADWRVTVAVATRWRAGAVVAAAFLETWQRLGLDVVHPALDWAATHAPTGAERRSLAVFTEERSFRRQALTGIGGLPWWDAPRYLWSLRPTRFTAPPARRP